MRSRLRRWLNHVWDRLTKKLCLVAKSKVGFSLPCLLMHPVLRALDLYRSPKRRRMLFLLTSYFIVNWASKLHDSSGWSSDKENFLLVSKLYFLIKIIVTNIIAWIRTNRIIVILLYLMFMFMIMKCLCWDGNVFYNKGIFFLFFWFNFMTFFAKINFAKIRYTSFKIS